MGRVDEAANEGGNNTIRLKALSIGSFVHRTGTAAPVWYRPFCYFILFATSNDNAQPRASGESAVQNMS